MKLSVLHVLSAITLATASVIHCDQDHNNDITQSLTGFDISDVIVPYFDVTDFEEDIADDIDVFTGPPRIPKIPRIPKPKPRPAPPGPRPNPRPKPKIPKIPKRPREVCLRLCTRTPPRCPQGYTPKRKGVCWTCCKNILNAAEVEQDDAYGDGGECPFEGLLD